MAPLTTEVMILRLMIPAYGTLRVVILHDSGGRRVATRASAFHIISYFASMELR